MKCAVVVVLCAGLAAASKHRINRQYDTGNSKYYSQEQIPYDEYGKTGAVSYEQEYVGSVEGNSLHHGPQYQHENYAHDASYAQPQYVEPYPVHNSVEIGGPTPATLPYGGAPLAPYPPQYNQHQIAPAYQNYGPPPLPHPNYGYPAPQPNYGYPAPQPNYGGYADLFGLYAPPGATGPKTTLITPAPSRPPKTTTTSAPNNIFSLLFSVSQLSSSLSQPTTTRRPAAIIATTATAQPAPKAQIFSFSNVPPQLRGQNPQFPPYPPQRAVFAPFLQ